MDIQVGDRVTYKYKASTTILIDIVTSKGNGEFYKRSEIEVLKVERPKDEVVEEKKELLTEEEKEFLKQYITIIESLNNGKVYTIKKENYEISLILSTKITYYAEIGSNFKGLDEGAYYSLDDLGLEDN